MARHMDAGPDPFRNPPEDAVPPRRGRGGMIAGFAGGIVVVLVVAACLPFVLPGVLSGVRDKLPWFPSPPCPSTTVVDVVTVPLIDSTVATLVDDLSGRRLGDGSCLSVRVRQQDPADTVASSSILPPARAPQVWVTDSSYWLARISRWKVHSVASFATTPVIVVSSGAAVNSTKNKGWTSANPTWANVFADASPLVVPNLSGAAQGPLALYALWASTGKGTAADRRVEAASAAARSWVPATTGSSAAGSATTGASAAGSAVAGSATVTSEDDVLSSIVTEADAGQPDAAAPFVVASEQAMVTINQDSAREMLAPIYPSDGSPWLDFPIVRLAEDQQDADHREGTDLVVAALQSAQARADAHALGLRDAQGGDAPTSQRGLPVKVTQTALPTAADLTRFVARFSSFW